MKHHEAPLYNPKHSDTVSPLPGISYKPHLWNYNPFITMYFLTTGLGRESPNRTTNRPFLASDAQVSAPPCAMSVRMIWRWMKRCRRERPC